ncbi:DUF3152 domain-containing protein [Streptomyces sp. NBC_00820]|uniref:DUF3152 domain-containing protein n=1 Tax=Streptomyces sp. NBC_00820 TaxID=2975842 RepID=UPI002ED42C8D|nr:DUF3152 domain-containing protein [Streptomyces sp. NBC_00820]
MGRHSRRGRAPKGETADIADIASTNPAARPDTRNAGGFPSPATPPDSGTAGRRQVPQATGGGAGAGRGVGAQRAAQGVPPRADGTPAGGVPRLPDGTPAHGFPRVGDGAARGGHPEQRERGGGWGRFTGAGGATGTDAAPGRASGAGGAFPRQRQAGSEGAAAGGAGPRQEYLDAFQADDGLSGGRPGAGQGGRRGAAEVWEPYDNGVRPADATAPGRGDGGVSPAEVPAQRNGGKGRAFAGIAAAAVTTVLAVVAVGHVAGRDTGGDGSTQSAADGQARGARTAGQAAPSAAPSAVTLTYDQKMGIKYPLGATLKGSGKFDAVPGFDKAPGKGRKYTYRVDVERGLGLDGALFAEAVQKTLNDERSWAHGDARSFERVSSGKPDFVITLASPGTTAEWCAKSGLDTTEDNVSCDSAATERVMINAYRWAQGSKTYGDKIHPYRQMLINHEVGHRLGHGHVTCQKDGELAPVMQQQTKFLDHDGIHCLPNPWPYPAS